MDGDLRLGEVGGLAEEVAGLRELAARLQAENARLLRLLELTPKQAAPPGPALAPEHRGGHGALYDALACGGIDPARLRRSLTGGCCPELATGGAS